MSDYNFPRPGWQQRTVRLKVNPCAADPNGERMIEAYCYGDLAVHRMVTDEGEDYGWTISHAPLGLRMSWDYNVFREYQFAIRCVEEFAPTVNDWSVFFDQPMPRHLFDPFCDAHRRSHERKEFLACGVVPSGAR